LSNDLPLSSKESLQEDRRNRHKEGQFGGLYRAGASR